MPFQKLRIVLIAALIFGAGGHPPYGQTETQSPGKLTAEQRREANRLVGLFRRARAKPQERARIVNEAIHFGRPAVAALYSVIVREMYPKLKSYRGKFYQQAAGAAKKRISQINLQEVANLRGAVLGLQQAGNLTKEAIRQRADPAVKRLAEIFLVDRAEVLEQSKGLKSERAKLFDVGLLWEQCGVYLYKQMPNDDNKPKEPPNFEKYLQGEENLAVGLAAPMHPQTRQMLVANARVANQLEPEEARAILAMNLKRNLLGLAPLAIDLKLCLAARDHSRDMRRLKFFAHDSPVEGKRTPWERAERFGTKAAAENIYHGAHDGRAATEAWFHSPGHHKNMLGQFTRVGVGRSGAYFTQLFGR